MKSGGVLVRVAIEALGGNSGGRVGEELKGRGSGSGFNQNTLYVCMKSSNNEQGKKL